MASTIIVNQAGKQIGRTAGFTNFVIAFVDENSMAWLQIPGEWARDIASQLAEMANENEALRKRIAELEGNG